MKRVNYCYVDGSGNEQVNEVTNEGGGDVGYAVDEHTARVWKSVGGDSETKIFPLSRIVFLRWITQYVDST